jgi:Na+-translocating ferredoxin:NAD+ oxidoreductase subunit B
MWIDVGSLTLIGASLGGLLGLAAKLMAVEEDPVEVELAAMLPGSQCGQCGFVGCGQYAAALAHDGASVTLCAPGGKAVAEALAKRLGVSADLSDHEDTGPRIARVDEDLCIGCLRCLGVCSVDAIVGAAKQMHTVIEDQCHGCAKCQDICPTEAIVMQPMPVTLGTWHWGKPPAADAQPATVH